MSLSESVDFDAEVEGTFIEKMNANEELFKEMLSMSEEANREFIVSRREEKFAMFWEEMEMTRAEVLSNVKDREDDFIEEFEDDGEHLPEWVLRAEAQDILIETVASELLESE